MLAMGHQLHISETIFPNIPINKIYLIFRIIQSENSRILFTPFNATSISEENKNRMVYMLFYISDSSLEVAIFIAITVRLKRISTTRMNKNRIARIQKLRKFYILFSIKWRKNKCFEDVVMDFLNMVATVHEFQPHTRKDVLIGFQEQSLWISSYILELFLMLFVVPISQMSTQTGFEEELDFPLVNTFLYI